MSLEERDLHLTGSRADSTRLSNVAVREAVDGVTAAERAFEMALADLANARSRLLAAREQAACAAGGA